MNMNMFITCVQLIFMIFQITLWIATTVLFPSLMRLQCAEQGSISVCTEGLITLRMQHC